MGSEMCIRDRFEDFLAHMNECNAQDWTWSFIEMCARFGIVYSTPECTLLARPYNSKISEEDLMSFNDVDPNHELALSGLTDKHDTWHVLYASGEPSLVFDHCPYELPYISWHRNKGSRTLKKYKYKQLKNRLHGIKSKNTA